MGRDEEKGSQVVLVVVDGRTSSPRHRRRDFLLAPERPLLLLHGRKGGGEVETEREENGNPNTCTYRNHD